MYEAKFYKKLENQAVACELCHHFCRIKNSAVGICSVRKNIGGRLYSLVYGQPAAMNIDPIEKKPLFHFQPGSKTFSLGTLGCNFKCANCQNWEISQATPLYPSMSGGGQSPQPSFIKGVVRTSRDLSLREIAPEKIVKQAIKSCCQSIAYTYNEPTVFAEYALDIMKLARQNNLKNVWVSNGYMSAPGLGAIIPYLDATNIDLKSMDEKFYLKYCGAKLKPVLNNLIAIKKAGIHLEITTLIIPKLSDGLAMLTDLAQFIACQLGSGTPWHVSKFSPAISWKLKHLPETDESAIFKTYEIGRKASLKYVYAGNLYGTDKENTYCPDCGQLAIKRLGYDIIRHDNNGHCAKCNVDLHIIA